jgi:hypothetical protein
MPLAPWNMATGGSNRGSSRVIEVTTSGDIVWEYVSPYFTRNNRQQSRLPCLPAAVWLDPAAGQAGRARRSASGRQAASHRAAVDALVDGASEGDSHYTCVEFSTDGLSPGD